jgi:hypothetical protein
VKNNNLLLFIRETIKLAKFVAQNFKACQINPNLKYSIFQQMEQSRRMLRTKNNCPEITNVFSCKNGQSTLLNHLPPQILKKIGQLNKISCCHINELP